MKLLFSAISLALLVTPLAFAQQTLGDYLEITIAKIRPEKRADFDALAQKIADADRKNKGDFWIAAEVGYGENNIVEIISQRQNYAAMDSAADAFMKAAQAGYGPGGMSKMMADFNNTITSVRSEIRRRRWDLTANAPTGADAYASLIGKARWFRTIRVDVRNGHEDDFEARVKEAKASLEKGSKWAFFVSEVVAGAPGNTYYITTPQPSLAAFDSLPKLAELMGQEAHTNWEKAIAEDEVTSEVIFLRLLPELSNPPEGIVKAAPDFWQPKRTASAVRSGSAQAVGESR